MDSKKDQRLELSVSSEATHLRMELSKEVLEDLSPMVPLSHTVLQHLMVNHMVHPSPMELPSLMVLPHLTVNHMGHPLPMVLLLTDNHTVLLSPMVPLSHTVLQHLMVNPMVHPSLMEPLSHMVLLNPTVPLNLTDNSHIELLSHMETPTSHNSFVSPDMGLLNLAMVLPVALLRAVRVLLTVAKVHPVALLKVAKVHPVALLKVAKVLPMALLSKDMVRVSKSPCKDSISQASLSQEKLQALTRE